MSQEQDIGRVEGKIDVLLQQNKQMMDWFQTHTEQDNKQFDKIHSSISSIKSKMAIMGAIALALVEGGRHALTSWFGGK
jgi:hypothetical protein